MKGISKHKQMEHGVKNEDRSPRISFEDDGEEINLASSTGENFCVNEEAERRRKDIRRREVSEEAVINEKVFYMEIKENENNKEKCRTAKEKELQNFEYFDAFEEVPDEDQDVLGTRFVLTEKSDGTVKARLVVKGFQERDPEQSDSPTASREIFKLFCSITANEGWNIESSDVRSAFLQSEFLDRDIYVNQLRQKEKDPYGN